MEHIGSHRYTFQFVFTYVIYLTIRVSLISCCCGKHLDKINLGRKGLLGSESQVMVHLHREVHEAVRPGVSPSQAVRMGPPVALQVLTDELTA